jgi:protein-arginine kinase activator protein McsA
MDAYQDLTDRLEQLIDELRQAVDRGDHEHALALLDQMQRLIDESAHSQRPV